MTDKWAHDGFVVQFHWYPYPMCLSGAYLIRNRFRYIPARDTKLTVSRIPLARGFPSNLTGFPPMYLETLSSSGSKVGFNAMVAAV